VKSIESVYIVGAGALGLLYMPPLHKALGDNCRFLTGNDRYETLKNKTFLVNGEECRFPVARADDLAEKADLILVAVKNMQLEEIIPYLRKAAGEDTIIVSVLNGIDSEDVLSRCCPGATVLPCAVLGMDAVKEGDRISYTTTGKFLVSTKDNLSNHPALTAFTDLLSRAGLDFHVPEDIQRELWYKWMINIGINQTSAVTGANYGEFQKERDAFELMKEAMDETIRVARAAGVDLRDEDHAAWRKILHSLGTEGKTSMLQDMEAGRKTEVDYFAGKLISLGKELGVETPVNRALYRIIRTRENLFS
jgi:2-dehydropantoate 2-reductase